MNLIACIAIGVALGWLASRGMGAGSNRGTSRGMFVGVAGALLGRQFLSPLMGDEALTHPDFSFPTLLVSLTGAILLLVALQVVRPGRLR